MSLCVLCVCVFVCVCVCVCVWNNPQISVMDITICAIMVNTSKILTYPPPKCVCVRARVCVCVCANIHAL